jgi:uncharacterized protein Yka (UPF0111/DUF47 family)
MKHRWFLPETPDVLGMLCAQLATTDDALTAFAAWAHGDATRADELRELEHRADDEKRALWRSLRTAFVTPVDAEDLFVMSAGLDEVVNGAKDTVREADVLEMAADDPMAEMADLLLEGVRRVGEAFAGLGEESDVATTAADAAVKSVRSIERVYRHAMLPLVHGSDARTMISRHELYTRVLAISERLRTVAERVWYAVVKEA